MTDFRKAGTGLNNHARPSRFFQDAGQWYFKTREGLVEGPFGCRHEAEKYLEAYVYRLASGVLASTAKLALQPLEMRWR